MDYKKLGLGLGLFSLGLGLLEIAAPRRLGRWLGVGGISSSRVIGIFGARELLAAATLLRAPGVSANVWNRVFGDGMDLAALGLAFSRSNRPKAVAGALGFALGATLVDITAARGLDRESGRTFPRSRRLAAF